MHKMLMGFLEFTESSKKTKTFKTYKALLVPFDRWLNLKGSSIDSFTTDDMQAYLLDKSDWSLTTGSVFLGAVKSYSKYALGRVSIGVEPDEIRRSLLERQRLELIEQEVDSIFTDQKPAQRDLLGYI